MSCAISCGITLSTHLAIWRQLTTPAHSHPEAHDVIAVPPVCPSPVAPQPPPAAGTLRKTLEARQPLLLQGLVSSVPILALLVRRVAVAYRVDPHPVATCQPGTNTYYVSRGRQEGGGGAGSCLCTSPSTHTLRSSCHILRVFQRPVNWAKWHRLV